MRGTNVPDRALVRVQAPHRDGAYACEGLATAPLLVPPGD